MSKRLWNHNKLSYGGDYNPEQWSEDVWEEDMKMFHEAHIDTLTLNVFSWASLQSDENTYHFERLDKIMDLVRQNGMKVCLATSTAVHPAWMARKYPEVLRTEADGMKRKFGSRHNSCPNSLVYQKYATRLAGKLAERYKDYDNIIGWHISNEFGGECYCENCQKAFRVWAKERYKTIENLNRAWNNSFWGHTLYDWEDIVLPDYRTEHWKLGDLEQTNFQGISLDYRRFNSESILNCYRMEYDTIKSITPDIPITTNLMGFYKPLDYRKWAKYMDFVSWDSYPANTDTPARIAMNHDLIRGLKGGMPFILMEQTPSVTNWQAYNSLKRPGVMRLWSYQAVAHGADSIMFFQMRRSIGACEKYHGAVIDHAGTKNTRVFREVAALGKELDVIGDKTLGARGMAKAAIVFDWENWWSVEYSAGPSNDLRYHDEAIQYYSAFHENNIAVDIIGTEDDLSQYEIVVAPILYMTKERHDERIREFVKNGGIFVTTYFSGYVDENDLVITGGYPGKLRDILGIWVEESDALFPEARNQFCFDGKEYEAKLLCDLMHLEGAEALAAYEKDFYAGTPVITKNQFGNGTAYYIGTSSEAAFYSDFVQKICKEKHIEKEAEVPEGVEAVRRKNDNGVFLFLLNHSEETKEVIVPSDSVDIITGKSYHSGNCIPMEKKDVVILQTEGL